MSVYGRIVTAIEVRKAVRDTIEKWLPAYLAEVSAHNGFDRDALPLFRSYTASPKGFQHWPEDQLPACVIVLPGPDGSSKEVNAGKYSFVWPVGVGVLCSANDQDSTNELVELYTAAVHALLVQHASLGGFASDTEWIDDDYGELSANDARSLAGGTVNLRVRVDAVLDSRSGPSVPPLEPLSPPASPPVVDTGVVVVGNEAPTFEQEIDI